MIFFSEHGLIWLNSISLLLRDFPHWLDGGCSPFSIASPTIDISVAPGGSQGACFLVGKDRKCSVKGRNQVAGIFAKDFFPWVWLIFVVYIDCFLIHRCGKYKKSLINAALPFTLFALCCYSPVTHLLPLNLLFEGHSNPNGITLSRKKSQDLEQLEVTKNPPTIIES